MNFDLPPEWPFHRLDHIEPRMQQAPPGQHLVATFAIEMVYIQGVTLPVIEILWADGERTYRRWSQAVADALWRLTGTRLPKFGCSVPPRSAADLDKLA